MKGKPHDPGLVYFMRRADGVGPIKIGCSRWPESRLHVHLAWSPDALEIIARAPGTFKDEERLHRQFSEHRLHGEWFEATRSLLALVARVAATGEIPAPPRNDKWERIADLYRAGKTLAEIGDEFGITRERARQILRKAGVPSLGLRKSKNAKVTAEVEQAILALADTHSPPEIAQRLGIERHNVYPYLRKHGVKAKRGKRAARPATIEMAFAVSADYKAGVKTHEIAEKYSIPQPNIYRLLKIAGSKANRGYSPLKTPLPDEEIARLYRDGQSLLTIAAQYGVTTGTIRRRIVDQGVSIRKQGDAVSSANARRQAA